uniref:Uncharacterized protein n=1 Tax=Populus trichocarpa TaxID=3694 RepID=A0A3N7G198_POPTR
MKIQRRIQNRPPHRTLMVKPRLNQRILASFRRKKVKLGQFLKEMLEVCWLDVTGSMTATKGKAYEISFILSMNEENSFGWEDPVYVMARIGEEGEYTRVKIDLSKLGLKEEEFPAEKCRVEFRSGENAKSIEKKLYFGLYEVWTNNWKGGLRIHEAIVRELTAEDSASTSNTRSDDSKVQEASNS